MTEIFEKLATETTPDVVAEGTPAVESASETQVATNTEVEQNKEVQVQTETKSTEPQTQSTQTNAEPNIDNYLKELGLSKEDLESLKESKRKEKEESEKPLNESKKWASVIANGIQEGTLTKEDVIKYESTSKAEDKDLVFEAFKKEFTPSSPDLDEEEINEELQDAFKKEYPSDKLIKLEAKSIRDEIAKPFQVAEKNLTQRESVLSMKKMHEEIVADVLSSKFAESFKLGDVELNVEVDQEITKQEVDEALTKTDGGKELLKMMHSLYVENKEASAELYKSFVTSLAKEKAQSKMIESVWQKASEHFKKEYSIGAQAPFGSQAISEEGVLQDGLKAMYEKRNN